MPNNIVMLSMGREWQREIKYKCTNMGELSCVSGRSRTELIIHCEAGGYASKMLYCGP